MQILQLNVAPTVSYAPAPPIQQNAPFTPKAPNPPQTYTVSLTAQFETENEAKDFAILIMVTDQVKCEEIK